MLIGWCTGIGSAGIELVASCGNQQVSSSSTFSAPGTEEPDVGPHDRQMSWVSMETEGKRCSKEKFFHVLDKIMFTG